MKSFKRNIIIIPLILVLFSSLQALGQTDLDSMKIITLEKGYNHQGNFYKKTKHLKPVIYSSQDTEAIRLFKNYRKARAAEGILYVSSIVTLIIGAGQEATCRTASAVGSLFGATSTDNCSQTPIYVVAGVLFGAGIVSHFIGNTSAERSIIRFNSLVTGQSKLSLRLLPDPP